MSTTTIVLVALLLIIIVGLIYAITSNVFGRRYYPPGHQYGYGYPPPYPPPYHHPHNRREYEDRSSPFWPFMILLTVAAVFYLISVVSEAGNPADTPVKEKISENEKYQAEGKEEGPAYKGEVLGTGDELQTSDKEEEQADGPETYGDEYGARKDSVEEARQVRAPDPYFGYGIQLSASEKDWRSAEDKEELRRRFRGRPLLKSPKWKDGSLLYRTIVGGFDTEAEAMDTRRELIRDFGKNIRVVKLSELSEASLYE